jgi:hypothetical protein
LVTKLASGIDGALLQAAMADKDLPSAGASSPSSSPLLSAVEYPERTRSACAVVLPGLAFSSLSNGGAADATLTVVLCCSASVLGAGITFVLAITTVVSSLARMIAAGGLTTTLSSSQLAVE